MYHSLLTILWQVVRHRLFSASPGRPIQASAASGDDSLAATGSNISQHVNSHNIQVNLPAPVTKPDSSKRDAGWRELIQEMHEAFVRMGYMFQPLKHSSSDDRNDPYAGIARGYRVIRNRLYIADAFEKAGLVKEWEELVQYVVSRDVPRDTNQRGCPTPVRSI